MIEVCLKYNSKFINIISFVLSFIIILCFCFGFNFIRRKISNDNIEFKYVKKINEVDENSISKDIEKIEIQNIVEIIDKTDDKTSNEFNWYIEIPKIKLYAPIEEGTNDEVLNRSVGHFEETSRKNGNCGFAAHNRGYRVNYFARLKELEKEDVIYYFVDGRKYEYEIISKSVIYETDWSMLEETEDNRITLITCIENREEYRLCIQGVLVEE